MDTRETLIRSGITILETGGIEAVGIRAVAAHAGVSHGAPRRYFPSLTALLSAIARRGAEDLDADLTPALRSGAAQAAVVYWRFASRRPHMFALMFRHDLLDGGGADLRAVTQGWLRTAGTEFGTDRAVRLWAAVHGLCVLAGTRATEAVGIAVDEVYVQEFARKTMGEN